MTCTECGMSTGDGSQFHPYAFCLLYKAGYEDPWGEFVSLARSAGMDVEGWPEKPPDMRTVWAHV